MKDAFVFICASILLFMLSGPAMAENVKMKDNPNCRQWHSVTGEWTMDGKSRLSRADDWKIGTEKSQIEWILDGSFVQIKGQDSDGVSSMKTMGYDARLATHVGAGFTSLGIRAVWTSGGWSGTTWTENLTIFLPDGKVFPLRCTVEHNLDYTSATGECQAFTDGKWWTALKGKSTKVK